MVSDTFLAVAGGLVAAEATGVTNFTGGGQSDDSSDGDSVISVPGGGPKLSLPDITLPEIAPAFDPAINLNMAGQQSAGQIAEILKQQRKWLQKQTKQTKTTVEDATTLGYSDVAGKFALPPDTSSGPGSSYDLQTDYQGPGGEFVRGGAEVLAQTGNVATGVTDFTGNNPIFSTTATAGAYTGNPALIALGAAGEVSADALTGQNVLGAGKSPIDITNQGAWYTGPDPLNLGNRESKSAKAGGEVGKQLAKAKQVAKQTDKPQTVGRQARTAIERAKSQAGVNASKTKQDNPKKKLESLQVIR